ncbi:hypothetical protein ALC56_14875 [Trachymyrmex septentrionalis]|uniref:Uncharacterized protein n=1 Tax=Trachymyrmex septentrionalis TaxID=34720 RepID=A0A195ES59_9HYME|nr:hypothetical protein ALC56_14875 [Trachymyrmex septentrionalis]
MRRDAARHGEAWQDVSRGGEGRGGKARRGEARRGEARRSEARRGETRLGVARRGEARRSELRTTRRAVERRRGREDGDASRFLLLQNRDWMWPIFRAPQTARVALFPGADRYAAPVTRGAVY